MLRAASRRPGPPPGQASPASPLLLLLLLACCAGACRGAPIWPQGLRPEQELLLWNEETIFMPNAEKPLCSSCVCVRVSQSSVVHPLLQLVPQLHERRMKRFKVDEELQGPFESQSRRYFLFRVCSLKKIINIKIKKYFHCAFIYISS
uniref:Neuromedin U C-terminal domain-containing protein n=1 Tax=Equus asinus asinus TaxID=83772 RepID=A0A8C4ML63_EQUAS